MRLSQMQDVAGCRIVVKDTLAQDDLVSQLARLVPTVTIDRRERPSYGYRAVHVIAKLSQHPVEIQVRTLLQHLWAELSEKYSDRFGVDTKYGGGDKAIRSALDAASNLVARFERIELNEILVIEVTQLRIEIARQLADFLATVKG
jgi:putative GTP pyrophosphokinase